MCHVIDIDNLIFNVSKAENTQVISFEKLVAYRLFIEEKIPNLYIQVTKDALFRNISSYGGLMSYDKPQIQLTGDISRNLKYSNNTIPNQLRDKYLKILRQAAVSF